jgi:hypothetical protein
MVITSPLSGPKSPPPGIDAGTSVRSNDAIRLPLMGMPRTNAKVKFHAKCNPMHGHKLRVRRK